MQQNMNNDLKELQAALKAYGQLAPHANSIQQIQKICNDLSAQAACINQLPSLEQAYKLYQQAYPAILQLQRIYPKLYAQAVAQSPAAPPLPVEELNGMIADMPEPKAWYKSIDKKKLNCTAVFLQGILTSLSEITSDESSKELLAFLSISISTVLFILNLNNEENKV